MRDKLRALIDQLRLHGNGRVARRRTRARRTRGHPGRGGAGAPAPPRKPRRAAKRSLAYRLAQARLPWHWVARQLPLRPPARCEQDTDPDAGGLDFLRRTDNVLLIGNPGTGKTGLALGLLREACLNGHRGRFYNAQVLLDELYASLADRTTTRLMAQLSRMQPLLIDELGYLTIKPSRQTPSSG